MNDFTKYRTELWGQLPNDETEVRVGASSPTALPRPQAQAGAWVGCVAPRTASHQLPMLPPTASPAGARGVQRPRCSARGFVFL